MNMDNRAMANGLELAWIYDRESMSVEDLRNLVHRMEERIAYYESLPEGFREYYAPKIPELQRRIALVESEILEVFRRNATA